MGISKQPALSHVVGTVRQVVSIDFNAAGIFESFHKIFKQHCRHTSKKRRNGERVRHLLEYPSEP